MRYQYFLRIISLALICTIAPLFGQSPGGVAGPGFWVKSDDAGAITTAWKDNSPNADNISNVGGVTLSPADRSHNFHPYTTGYTSSKYFNNTTSVMNPTTGTLNNTSHSIFSVVRPSSLGTGRITGIDNDPNNAAEPGISITGGAPRHYEFSNTTTQTDFNTDFTAGVTNVFSAIANNSVANAGTSTFSGGEKVLGLNGTYATTTYSNSNRFQFVGRVLRVGYGTWNVSGAFPGDIMEVIWYKRPLTGNEQSRVNSYLAIKNGVTSNENYLSTASTVVWDRTSNTGYNNNIFGIARDNASLLHQKQAGSVNNGQQLVISTTGFADNNVANNTGLASDLQFLMIGDNSLKQTLNTPFVYTTGSNGVTNYRFDAIWKVQNTNGVNTVTVAWPKSVKNLYLVQSPDAAFDGTDTFTPMVTEVTINGVVYNTANVVLANGQYFTFAGFSQFPGGVAGPDFWVKSDDAGTISTAWKDNSPNADNIPNVGGVTLSPADRSHNFHPYTSGYTGSKYFLNSTSVLNPTNGQLNNISHSIFSAVRPTTAGTGRIIGIDDDGNAAEPGFSINDGKLRIYKFTAGANADEFDEQPFNIGAANIVSGIGNNPIAVGGTSSSVGGERLLGVNGVYKTYPNTTSTNRFHIQGQRLRIGDGAFTAPGSFPGDIMEVVWYKRPLTDNEQSRVNSYLAVKNGVTSNENYLSTASTVVWDRTINNGYNNNIFGIAKDDFTVLHQKQAGSVNSGQQLVISTTGFADSNVANNTGLSNDLQFLMTGDNGLKQGLSLPISGITGVNYRFESIWKTQNTGNVGTVRVAWPSGLTNLRLIQSPDIIFDNTDAVTDMSVNTQIVNGVTYNYADVTLANGQYFTLAAFAHAPGGVFNGLSQWYRADIDAANTGNGSDVTSWKDYFGGTISAQLGTNTLPKYKIGSAAYFNFNPGVNFTAITQTLGNNTVQTITNTSFDVFSLTKEGMTAPSSPTPHYLSIGRDNTTTGVTNWDYLGLLPSNTDIERRVVGGGTQFPNSGIAFSNAIPSIMYNTFTNTTLARGLNGALSGAIVPYSAVGLALGGHIFGDTRFSGNNSDNGGIVGDIGETIIYGGGNINIAERRKVDTYLAIKYGITLGRVATDNYISSADGIVWNGALSTTYNNNVFGLAKDDISSLHQKVSKSVNTGTILTMATNNDFVSQNIATSRASLSGDFKFFMAGDNSLTASPLVAVTISGVSAQRIQRIWLSQRTNTVGDIYFSANLSAYGAGFAAGNNIRMFVADDAAFTSNVQSVAGTFSGGQWVFNKNFDGDATARYITFGAEPQPQVLWLKADKGVNTFTGVPATDNTQLSTWFDQMTVDGGQNGISAVPHPATPAEIDLPAMPYYKYNSTDNFNFNPVVNFDGTNNGQAVQIFTPTKRSQTVFSVFKSLGNTAENAFYASGLLYGGDVLETSPTDGDAVPKSDISLAVRSQSRITVGGGSDGDFNFPGNVLLNNLPSIGTFKRDRRSDEEVYLSTYASGTTEVAAQNVDPTNTMIGEGRDLINAVRIGKAFSAYENGLSSTKGKLFGSVAETIVYDQILTEAERAKVESYLAVKYGITLTGGTQQSGVIAGNAGYNYVNSAGAVVRASDATYKFDVFGLGRDDFYGLNQRISKSNNPGDILTVSTNTDFTSLNLDAVRTAIDGDREFMLFANNRGSTNAVVEQVTELPATIARRLDREWKVAQANTDGTDIPAASLRFNLAGVTLTGATATNVMLLVDTDGDGNFTTGTVQKIPASAYTAGSAVSFNNVTLTSGQVFTLGITQDLCYKPGAVASIGNPALESKVGITVLNRAGSVDADNWPMTRHGGWLVMEAKTKGFVVNKVAFAAGNPVGIAPADFVEGMMVYDNTNKCMKIYTLKDGDAASAWHCLTTQTCPD